MDDAFYLLGDGEDADGMGGMGSFARSLYEQVKEKVGAFSAQHMSDEL